MSIIFHSSKVLGDDDKRRSHDNFGTADFGGAAGNWALAELSLLIMIWLTVVCKK